MEVPNYKFALTPEAAGSRVFLPTRGEPNATGWDVRACIDKPITMRAFEYAKIPLGIRAFCPDGWWFEVRPRSSTFAKKHLHCLYGVVDQDFEGQLMLILQNIPEAQNAGNWLGYDRWTVGQFPNGGWMAANNGDRKIEPAEALAQIVPVRRQEMIIEEISNEQYDQLCKTRGAVRGSGGFGSTG